MNKKNFALSPLAAAILLASSGISAQTNDPAIVSQNDNQEINVAADQVVSAVVIQNEDVELNNDGTIISDQTAVDVIDGGDDAEINNDGLIDGDVNGVRFTADVDGGELENEGVILSDSRAVDIQGDDIEIENDGVILVDGVARNGAVYTNRTAQDTQIENSEDGVIAALTGAGISAELVAEGTDLEISNDGLILGNGDEAAGSATAGDGIRLERTRTAGSLANGSVGTFEGEIENNGAIVSASDVGTVAGIRTVDGVNFQGEIENEEDGVIFGVRNGVYFGDGDHEGGELENEGLIASDSRALNIDGTGLRIENEGAIIGTGDQRNGTVYADSTAQDFILDNEGVIDAGEGNQGAGFSVELSAEGNDFEIDNSGVIQGRGQANAGLATAGDGIRLERTRVDGSLANPSTGLFTGVINNSGTIDSESAQGTTAGIRTVDGVSFQGAIINQEDGVISGTQNGLYFGNGDHTGGVALWCSAQRRHHCFR